MTQAQAPPFGKWVAVFQKLDNGEDKKLFLELNQDRTTLKGHFHTLGYGGDLSGTIENGRFVLFALWDKIKPFCTGKVFGGDLTIDLGWGSSFTVKPETPSDVPSPPVYLAPSVLHKEGSNGLAKTPPMGWNSWNKFGGSINDAVVREIADEIVANGMKDAGYTYININDTWEGVWDENGVPQPNKKFPDMKALANYVHSKGLKLASPLPPVSAPAAETLGVKVTKISMRTPGQTGHRLPQV
jgi:alpha-galactosidase